MPSPIFDYVEGSFHTMGQIPEGCRIEGNTLNCLPRTGNNPPAPTPTQASLCPPGMIPAVLPASTPVVAPPLPRAQPSPVTPPAPACDLEKVASALNNVRQQAVMEGRNYAELQRYIPGARGSFLSNTQIKEVEDMGERILRRDAPGCESSIPTAREQARTTATNEYRSRVSTMPEIYYAR